MISASGEDLRAIGNSLFGSRYRMRKEVSRGPAASLYRAADLEADRPVAIKLFLARYHADPRFAIRFRDHLRRLAALKHENLAAVLDYGIELDRYYIITEWVEGIDLGSYIAEYGPLPSAAAIHIARQACAALESIHGHGLIHQGIKPRNILVTADGQVKVTDTGISALLSESGLSKTHVMVAGAGYISPEQARGHGLTIQSDLYGLGVTLFEMLAGRPLFEAKDTWSVVQMHAREKAPSPRQFNREVPEDLADLVMRALQKEPELRFASAAEMGAALSALKSDPALPAAGSSDLHDQPGALDFRSRLKILFQPGTIKDLLLRPWQIAGRKLPFGALLAFLAGLAFLIAFGLLYLSAELFR